MSCNDGTLFVFVCEFIVFIRKFCIVNLLFGIRSYYFFQLKITNEPKTHRPTGKPEHYLCQGSGGMYEKASKKRSCRTWIRRRPRRDEPMLVLVRSATPYTDAPSHSFLVTVPTAANTLPPEPPPPATARDVNNTNPTSSGRGPGWTAPASTIC